MSFSVEHHSVRTFADTLGGLADEAPNAANYVREHLDIGYADARLFATIAEACSDAREALIPNYEGLQRVAEKSATETGAAATFYRTTDAGEASRLDSQYGSGS